MYASFIYWYFTENNRLQQKSVSKIAAHRAARTEASAGGGPPIGVPSAAFGPPHLKEGFFAIDR